MRAGRYGHQKWRGERHDLGIRFEGWLLEQQRLEPDQERCCGWSGNQIKANAGTMDRFGIERFVDPPFTLPGRAQPRRSPCSAGTDRLQTAPGRSERGCLR